ncbi:DUF1097 domain-containing protein [Methylopila turkensis]|uniref:DUF1097 domain-containing protein n=1 Tax=Methylopila turkensis TaxID=1437816 RepID=A0A9W6JN08_9HYPH|nr:DUF1097 domain-containing protein [Methylopila turkensis]GLK80092.1 hypothetical protein GCM10008174_18330 [Methylopila turkensis]
MSEPMNDAVVERRAAPAASLIFISVAAIVAACSAFASLTMGFAPWAMFVGWVAYFTRPISAAEGLKTGLCVWLGITLGAGAALALGALTPTLGQASIIPVVFVAASIVLAFRSTPPFENVLAWFLGLITFFASHLAPSLLSIAELCAAASLGIAAGWAAQRLQAKVSGAH